MRRTIALALLAPLFLFACGSGSDGDDRALETDETVETTETTEATEGGGGSSAAAALAAAPDAAAEAGSGRFEMTMAIEAPEGAFEMVATGGFSGDQMSMEMDMAAMFRDLAEAAGEPLPPGVDEPMQMVFDGETFYMRWGLFDLVTGTSGWLAASPEDLGQSGDALGLGSTGTSPTSMMEGLRGVSDDVEEVGREEVRGVETTRYSATIDWEKALAQVPEEQRADLEAQLDQLGGTLDELPVDVWVDDEGLPRRMVMAFEGFAGPGSGAMTMTMDMFDYGEPFEVQVPDPSEVTPFSEVMGGMGGLGGAPGSLG